MKDRICKLSLFSMILASVSAVPVDAAVNNKGSSRSYAGAYQQVSALSNQQAYFNATATNATTASATANLPVMVDDERLANSIINNEANAPAISSLEACSMIYPNGVFKWAVPESGVRQTPNPQCVAVVELRDAISNAVLATTTVAAGDSMKCNIDYFPESGFNVPVLSKTELPADAAPTIEDVEAVMNQEQKQNAGLKIAAGAIIAGVAGNLLAPKEAGSKTGKIPIGTGKTQLIDTAIGAAAGAGIMAASSYSGKVAGDTIKSTAVNAASGMLVGNMMAGANSGNGVVATTKCSISEGPQKGEFDCVVGKVQKTAGDLNFQEEKFYIISRNGRILKECAENTDESGRYTCTNKSISVMNIILEEEPSKDLKLIDESRFQNMNRYELVDGTQDKFEFKTGYTPSTGSETTFYKVASAQIVGETRHAYAVFRNGSLNKAFGYKGTDWNDATQTLANMKPLGLYARNSDGTVGSIIENETNDEGEIVAEFHFTPSSRDSDDGGLIDMSNQARAKGTIVGTAAGGALGGFAGYQGAKTEVSERWTTAVREYEDSLSNVVCMTGNRFLAKYNDDVIVPAMIEH